MALIAPPAIAELNTCTGYALALPALCQDLRYLKTFQEAADKGCHTILDNGAAEGELVSWHELHATATLIGAKEIVVPDALGDSATTIKYAQESAHYAVSNFDYVGVAQGSSWNEIWNTIYAFVNLDYITVLALPRLLGKQGRDRRLAITDFIQVRYPGRFKAIHCLGAFDWVSEVKELATQGIVRGIDTSTPVYYGYIGRDLYYDDVLSQYVSRPEGFFDFEQPNSEQQFDIIRNCASYLAWAGITPPPLSEVRGLYSKQA